MDAELNPCPFCGGGAEIERGEEGGYYVSCGTCYTVVGEAWGKSASYAMGYCNYGLFEDEKEALEAWNKRAPVV